MGKVIALPGVELDPPSRTELVDEISDMMLQMVINSFENIDVDPGPFGSWYRSIRDYFWYQEIHRLNGTFRPEDVKEWTDHWESQVKEYVRGKTT